MGRIINHFTGHARYNIFYDSLHARTSACRLYASIWTRNQRGRNETRLAKWHRPNIELCGSCSSSSERENITAGVGGGYPQEVFRLPRELNASSLQQARRRGELAGRRVDQVPQTIRSLRASRFLGSEGILLDPDERRGRPRASPTTVAQRSDPVDELEEEGRRGEEIGLLQLRHQLRGETRAFPEARRPRGQDLPQGCASRWVTVTEGFTNFSSK